MSSLEITESEINKILAQFSAEGLALNDARAVAIRFLEDRHRKAEKDRNKAKIEAILGAPLPERPIPSKAAAIANQDLLRADREARYKEQQEAKKQEQHKLGNDLWHPLNQKDAKRFRDLGIDQNRDRQVLIGVPWEKRHAAVIACMYHLGHWGIVHGLIRAETPVEQIQDGIFRRIKPEQDKLLQNRNPGPIKSDMELWRLAESVARHVHDSLHHWRDIDAARRGGINSGIVRRDKAESTTWKQVIELAESGLPKAEIAREVGISRRMVYKILKQGVRFSNGKSNFR